MKTEAEIEHFAISVLDRLADEHFGLNEGLQVSMMLFEGLVMQLPDDERNIAISTAAATLTNAVETEGAA